MPDPLGSFEYTWPFYFSFILGYLIGSIPFGLLLVKFSGLGDIRSVGSGNIGATNVLRTGKKSLAIATLLLDGGKGTLATFIAIQFGPDMGVLAAAGAIIGHCFPAWLKFRGGGGCYWIRNFSSAFPVDGPATYCHLAFYRGCL